MKGYTDTFIVDEDNYLLDLYRAGSVISYISVLLNIVILAILCRKTLRLPATILMQGLAAADLLTAFSCYGLQPIFQSKYVCNLDFKFYQCYLPYPYCSISPHLSILSFTFHNVSSMITACLGIQKVIAILFPVWTKNQLTKQKAAICCVMCFLLSIAIGIPRHFSIWSENLNDFADFCLVQSGGDDILEYSSVTYLLIQTVLLTSCCLVMLISTIFIVYKLLTNKFRGQMTEQRRQERRSVAMVIVVLMMFIITEVPKVIVYLWWCFNYINGNFVIDAWSAQERSVMLIQRYEYEMSLWLASFIIGISNNYSYTFFFFAMLMEGIRLFTIIGCMSNFIIYIMMSTKMRKEIILLLTKIITRCTHKDQMHQTREAAHGRTQPTYKIEMHKIEQQGKSRSHNIEINTMVQQDQINTPEEEMNRIEQAGQSYAHEIEMNSLKHQDKNRSHELMRSEYQGQSLTHEVEINTIEQPGQTHTHEVQMHTVEQPGQSRTHEVAMNTIEQQGQSRTHEVERNTIEQPGQIRTHEVAMNRLDNPRQSRTHEVAKNRLENPRQSRTHEVEMIKSEHQGQSIKHAVEMNRIEQPEHSRTHEIVMNRTKQPGQSRIHEVKMNRLEPLK
ncbi:Hypothetical predicted protein [Mytilus galloprovincialis]|uniref:G-protein coupled receptors family 1 profile domain-containing protein n=1 Tax=Mytilus galloprovincialis TaxID=29158 RepID=A0A8B6FWK7_MYTGA|nr:Hypothetical predicted protein [Mytilus galloprovincialis]